MKNLKIFLIGLLPLIAGACTQMRDADNDLTPQKPDFVESTYFISLEKAIQNAGDHFKLVYGEDTRTGRKVSEVETFRQPTRSGDDELFGYYIVNYENEGGFALLSADSRRDATVYAISDEGSLHLSDTIDNKGLAWYLNETLSTNDSLPFWGGKDLPPVHPLDPPGGGLNPTTYVKTVYCTPILSKNLSEFHQSFPYNYYCPVVDGYKSAAGCCPVAMASIIGLFQPVESYDGYHFNWAEMMLDKKHEGWPSLIAFLGDGDNLKVRYTPDASSCSESRIIPTFSNWGLHNTVTSVFTCNVVNAQLAKKNILLCIGTGETTDNLGRTSDHIWVIDGGYNIKGEYNDDASGSTIQYSHNYYHCVWGAAGMANGYFIFKNCSLGGVPDVRDDNGWLKGEIEVFNNLHVYYGFRK